MGGRVFVRCFATTLVVSLWAQACVKRESAAPQRALALGQVEVAFAGCAETVADRCLLGNQRRLHFWVQTSTSALEAWTEQGPMLVKLQPIEGGQAFDVVVPKNARSVGVGTRGLVWRTLNVGDYIPDPFVTAARADAKRDAGGTRARLERDLRAATPERRASIQSLLGRLAMQTGDYVQAAAWLEASMSAFRGNGQWSSALKDGLSLAFIETTRLGSITKSFEQLEGLAPLANEVPEFRAEHAYQVGLVESWRGNFRAALSGFRASQAWARRMKNDNHVLWATQQWLAMTLLSLGRHDEALVLEKQTVASVGGGVPCIRGALTSTAAWVALQQTRLNRGLVEEWLGAASRDLGLCGDPFRLRNVWINEGLYGLRTGSTALVKEALAKLNSDARGKTTTLAVLEFELLGRFQLAQGMIGEADLSFNKALALTRTAGMFEDELRLSVAKSLVLIAAGRAAAAIALLLKAEDGLEERLQFVPLGEGRTRFLEARDEGAQGLIAGYLAVGNKRAAFEAARRARARSLRSVMWGERSERLSGAGHDRWFRALATYNEARAKIEAAAVSDWKLSQSELVRALEERETLRLEAQQSLDQALVMLSSLQDKSSLALKPESLRLAPREVVMIVSGRATTGGHERSGLMDAFLLSSVTIEHAVVAAEAGGSSNDVTHPWLQPFVASLRSAGRLRVLPTNKASEEIHSFSFNEKPLGMQLPVVYSLDVPTSKPSAGSLLVVSDPTQDLPQALAEGNDVAAMWVGKAPVHLFGASANRPRVLSELGKAGWFHYAGHAVFAGVDGLETGLPLADGQRLLASDVLAMASVPALVVLSACDAGRSAGESNTAGLGLAQAFILAGSTAVVAPTRPVADGFSRRLMKQMYKQLSLDLPVERALQAAQLDTKLQQETDWSAFRVLVP